jgi:hypothetical protein
MNTLRARAWLSIAVFGAVATSGAGCGSSKGSSASGGKGGGGGGGVGGLATGAGAAGGLGGAVGGGPGGAAAGSSGAGGGGGGPAGGSGGAGGGSPDGGAGSVGTAAFAWYFDTSTDGFALSPYGLSSNLLDVEGGALPTLGFDGGQGMPNKGSLAVSATFTGYDQGVFTTITLKPTINGTGKTIHAWIKLDAGSFPGGVELQATGGGMGVTGTLTPLTAGTWTELTLDLTAARTATSGFDPSQISQIGVQFYTGDSPSVGAAFTPVTPTFHIDSVSDGSGGTPPLFATTFDDGVDNYDFTYALGTTDAAVVPAMVFDPKDGSPSPGSLQVSATFTDFGQSATPILTLLPDRDFSGKTLHAMVKLDSGTFMDGYAVLFASSTSKYIWVYSTMTPLTAGTWTPLSINLATATPPTGTDGGTFDPTDINQVGVQFMTNPSPGGTTTFPGPEMLSFHADSIYVTNNP